MMTFKYYNDSLLAAASLNEACPPDVAIDTAYTDFLKTYKQRMGFLHCKCLEIYNDNGGDVSTAFALFSVHVSGLQVNPCEDWAFSYDYAFHLTIISGAMIGILNAVCVAVFELVPVMFEGCLTYQAQTRAQFSRIVIIQFMFIACVLLFADFSLGESKTTGFPILQGNYRDFDTGWYFAVGSKISFAMISNSIAPFFGELAQPLVVPAMRYVSRSFKKHLLKETNVLEAREKAAAEEAKNNGGKKGAEGKDKKQEEKDEEEGGAKEETFRSYSPLKKRDYEGGDFMADGGDDEGSGTYGDEDAGAGSESDADVAPAGKEKPEAEEEEFGEDEPECEGAFGGVMSHLFQDDLNAFYTNPVIKVFYWYAWFFTNLLVYLTYGGGMPLMYPLGVLFFFLMFYVCKFLFLRFYRITFGFDESLPLYAVNLMKWAVFFHLMMNAFMFTNKRLLTPPIYNPEIHYRPDNEPAPRWFRKRYSSLSNLSVAAVLVAVIILYLIWRFMISPIIACCRKREKMQKALRMEEEELKGTNAEDTAMFKQAAAEDHSDDILKELSIRYLRTLYIRCHKEFELFRTMVNAISYDQEKLSDDDAKLFKKRLKQRIRQIEDTIDVHLNLIGGLERWMDKTYLFKLAALEANEDKIALRDPKS